MNIGSVEVDINDYLKVRDAFLYEKCGSHIVKRLKTEIDFYERENLNVSHLEGLVADFLITRDIKTNGRLREWWQLSCKINEDDFKKLLEMSLFELGIFSKRPKNFYDDVLKCYNSDGELVYKQIKTVGDLQEMLSYLPSSYPIGYEETDVYSGEKNFIHPIISFEEEKQRFVLE